MHEERNSSGIFLFWTPRKAKRIVARILSSAVTGTAWSLFSTISSFRGQHHSLREHHFRPDFTDGVSRIYCDHGLFPLHPRITISILVYGYLFTNVLII